jgi:hypothetical protein
MTESAMSIMPGLAAHPGVAAKAAATGAEEFSGQASGSGRFLAARADQIPFDGGNAKMEKCSRNIAKIGSQ